jgi:hypothetical protein
VKRASTTLALMVFAASLVAPVGAVEPQPTGEVGTALIGGTLSYVSPRFGPEYLALPFPQGTVATICAVECVTRRSTDFGPDQRVHPNRIADLSAADFERVCGFTPAERVARGLCKGTVELEPPVDPRDDAMRDEDQLPATSTEGMP